jgi:hypothetical protein
MLPAVLIALALLTGADPVNSSPITCVIPEGKQNATFTNALHPGNRIGYRFHEHTPLTYGEVSKDAATAGIDPGKVAELEADFAHRPKVLVKKIAIGDADWAPQTWTFYMAPVEDGIELLWIVETADKGINDYYGVQQCFRLGGKSNQTWRREYAETPAFSEYDLWDVTQKDSADKTSLTYVLRGGKWGPLPAVRETVGARTPLGVKFDTLRAGGDLNTMPKVGPYDARMLDPVDTGLIARVNLEKTWVCGIYWERTSHVTVHHPADCLHSIVNIGGVPPHGKRAIWGKMYWFEGTLDDLRVAWKAQFSND